MRLLELPAIMPPPPCLFVEAIVPPGESGSQYVFQGWSLNQLDGLASDFGKFLLCLECRVVCPNDYNHNKHIFE